MKNSPRDAVQWAAGLILGMVVLAFMSLFYLY